VLMPPLCITIDQLTQAVTALRASIITVWGRTSGRNRPPATAEPVRAGGRAGAPNKRPDVHVEKIAP
jgi:hypothetical protein